MSKLSSNMVSEEGRNISSEDIYLNYLNTRLKDLSVMLANYEDHRDSMQKDEDTSYYDRLVLVGRARIEELIRLKKVLKLE